MFKIIIIIFFIFGSHTLSLSVNIHVGVSDQSHDRLVSHKR